MTSKLQKENKENGAKAKGPGRGHGLDLLPALDGSLNCLEPRWISLASSLNGGDILGDPLMFTTDAMKTFQAPYLQGYLPVFH